MEFSSSPDERKIVAPEDSQPNWLEGHVLNPFANGLAVTPYNAVANAVKAVDPQADVKADRAANRVDVQSEQPREVLAAAIREEGYAVA